MLQGIRFSLRRSEEIGGLQVAFTRERDIIQK
jgi:hypothetical protein